MFKLSMSASRVVLVVLSLNLAFSPEPARAQGDDASQRVVGLLRDAMDAYGNLDFDSCKSLLDEATQAVPQLDKKTAARVYVTYGMLNAGGYADNATGEQDFKIAICLDAAAALNPMFSTPEIDLLFNMAKQQAQPDVCPSILDGIQTGGEVDISDIIDTPLPTITPCGDHDPITEQKQKYELPFFLTLAPEMRGQINKVIVRYAFDSADQFTEVVLPQRGAGYGAMLTCDLAQIRVYDPATVSYYIEGLDNTGQVVCGHGTVDAPLEILMMPDATVLPSIAGMQPKECAPCPPWDEKCGTGSIVSNLGDPCTPDVGCGEGMICGDLGICEMGKEEDDQTNKGPEHFYVNLTGGVGFGYLNKSIEIRQMNYDLDPEYGQGRLESEPARGAIQDVKETPAGMAFGGIPLRLAIGFFVTPNLSVEVSGRFDVYVTSTNEPKSCWEAGGGSVSKVKTFFSDPNTADSCAIDGLPNMDDARLEAVSRASVVQDAFGNDIMTKAFQYAWLINARVRYRLVHKGIFGFSLFGGIGYGHIQYRIAGDDTAYFPMPGMVDIELGPGLAFYFNQHFGIVVDVPIDIIVGDGFALNFDVTLGLSFGF